MQRNHLVTAAALGLAIAASHASANTVLRASHQFPGGQGDVRDEMVQMMAEEVANADVGTMGYLTNAKVRGKLKQTSKVSGQNGFIWEAGNTPVNGYMAGVSNQVPSNLTKGTGTDLSAVIFGAWADLLIGQWGGIDLIVDDVTEAAKGNVRLVAHSEWDIAVRHAESFAAIQDAQTE